MDGMEIINSFKKETLYEFSEAIPILNDNLYFIFKADIISIDINPSQTKMDKLKELIKPSEKPKNSISYIDIEPIAYLLKTKANQENNQEYDYKIEAIDEKYNELIEKNRDKLLKEFLER